MQKRSSRYIFFHSQTFGAREICAGAVVVHTGFFFSAGSPC